MLRKTLSLILVLVAALGVASAQVQNTTHWYFAANYGQWTLQGQRANTYLFSPGNVCLVPQVGGGVFFPFNTNAPVWIQDVTAANSETVTPSVVIQNSSQCGVTISPGHQHFSFSFHSGTGGLQEALNAIGGSSSHPSVLFLDPLWYQYAAAVPGTTPAAIIAAAVGKASVYLVDITTPTWTIYSWNSTTSKYQVAQLSNAVTLTSSTPATTRAVIGSLTTSNATLNLSGEKSLVGVRGLFTVPSGTTVSGDDLVRLASDLTDSAVAVAVDDGISQIVSTKRGIVLRGETKCPGIVSLTPFISRKIKNSDVAD